MRAYWSAVLALALVAGCGSSQSAANSSVKRLGSVTHFAVNGQPTVLISPRNKPNGRLVLFLHGAGQTADELLTDRVNDGLEAALLSHGYTLAGSLGGGDAWGSPVSVSTYVAVAKAAAERAGTTGLYVLAESMGGLAGMRLVDRLPVVAWAGIYPVCNLQATAAAKPGNRASIVKALGSVPSAGLTLPLRATGLPMLLWSSPNDQVVPKASNTDACGAALTAKGASVRVVATTGDHWRSWRPV